MISEDNFRALALSLPETTEEPHFQKTSFRVMKKIFATFDRQKQLACLKLSEADQDLFGAYDRSAIYPVPGKWGKRGWTMVDLGRVHVDILNDSLLTSYRGVAPAKLTAQLQQ